MKGSGVVSSQKWCVFLSNIFRLIRTYSHLFTITSTRLFASTAQNNLFQIIFTIILGGPLQGRRASERRPRSRARRPRARAHPPVLTGHAHVHVHVVSQFRSVALPVATRCTVTSRAITFSMRETRIAMRPLCSPPERGRLPLPQPMTHEHDGGFSLTGFPHRSEAPLAMTALFVP